MNKAQPINTFSLRKKDESLGFTILKLSEFRAKEPIINRCTPHKINFYLMIVITKGNGLHEIDFKKYNYSKGDIIFISKGQVHQWDATQTSEGYMLIFNDNYLTKYFTLFHDSSFEIPFNQSLNSPLLSLSQEINSKTFKTIFEDIYDEFKISNSAFKTEIINSQLRIVFLKLQSLLKFKRNNKKDAQLDLFLRFQESVELYLRKSRNATDYLKWLSVSYIELNNACKCFSNKTIKEYIDTIIIVNAKRSLTNKSIPINKIAFDLGFDEATNFTKFFKKRTQFTPRKFRQLL